ncbi:hypothetical protein IJ750_07000 [bacterium]|nr:hypothetical protein [bacterium]
MTNINEKFYHDALRALKTGTTKNEFAEVYANAGKVERGSSIWNELFQNGQQIFTKYIDITDTNDIVDESEISLFTTFLNYLKNLPSAKDDWNIPKFIGHGKQDGFNPQGSECGSKYKDDMRLQNLPEISHLKSTQIMSHEELVQEILSYIPDMDLSGYENDIDLRAELDNLREVISNQDKNSDIIDYHAGSFSQGQRGTCAPLSQIAQLTDEQLREMVTEGVDDNGKFYVVTFPMDKNNPENAIKVYERDILDNKLRVEGLSVEESGFVTGDMDVRLLEMAYALRFGVQALTGATATNVQRIFTSPDEKQPEDSVAVTEENIKKALENGHATLGLTYFSQEDENMNMTDVITSPSGITGRWTTMQSRASLEETLSLKFPQIDKSKYENLNDGEFLEFIMLFCEDEDSPVDMDELKKLGKTERKKYIQSKQKFDYTQCLELSNGQIIKSAHAYILKAYNSETREITIADPEMSYADINVPIEIAEKFMRVSV